MALADFSLSAIGEGRGEVSLDFGYRLSLSISTGFIGTQYKSLENVIFMFYELLGR